MKSKIWAACRSNPYFSNFNASSFQETVTFWGKNPLFNFLSITIFFTVLGTLQQSHSSIREILMNSERQPVFLSERSAITSQSSASGVLFSSWESPQKSHAATGQDQRERRSEALSLSHSSATQIDAMSGDPTEQPCVTTADKSNNHHFLSLDNQCQHDFQPRTPKRIRVGDLMD